MWAEMICMVKRNLSKGADILGILLDCCMPHINQRKNDLDAGFVIGFLEYVMEQKSIHGKLVNDIILELDYLDLVKQLLKVDLVE